MGQPHIVYVLSYPRSGSTLLANILDTGPDHFHMGEVERMWVGRVPTRVQGMTCGCGEQVLACDTWSPILERAVAHLDESAEPVEMMARMWKTPGGPASSTSRYAGRPAETADLAAALYHETARHTGAHWLVDSSKSLSYALLLHELLGERLVIVHLIRDIRGVIASRVRSMRERRSWNLLRMLPYIARDTWEWRRFNDAAARQPWHTYRAVGYPDLIDDTARVVERLGAPGFSLSTPLEFPVNHTVHGNRNRFETGAIELVHDLRWQSELPRWLQWTISVASRRTRRRYGLR